EVAEHAAGAPASTSPARGAEEVTEVEPLAVRREAEGLAVATNVARTEAARVKATGALALPHLLDLVGVHPLIAVTVVLLALLGIAQHLEGGVDLLELRFGLGVAGVHVRMPLAREATEGGPDLLLGGGLRDAQDGI